MAQTKRKRTRKHRGTPAGTIERAGKTGRPQTRQDAKTIARERRQERLDIDILVDGEMYRWRCGVNLAALAAVVFGVLVVALFDRSIAQGSGLAAFMFLLYIPLGFVTDKMIYSYRMKKKAAAR